MRTTLLLLLLPALAFSAQKKWTYPENPKLDDELSNVYNSINAVPNGVFKKSSMTVQGITTDSITVNSLISGANGTFTGRVSASSGAFTNGIFVQGSTAQVIAARYTTATAGSYAATTLNFDTKDYDTANAVTTGANWKFTAPVAGTYCVDAAARYQAFAAVAVGDSYGLVLQKNGSDFSFLHNPITQTTTSILYSFSGADCLSLAVGDTISVYIGGVSGTHSLSTSALVNHIAIWLQEL